MKAKGEGRKAKGDTPRPLGIPLDRGDFGCGSLIPSRKRGGAQRRGVSVRTFQARSQRLLQAWILHLAQDKASEPAGRRPALQ